MRTFHLIVGCLAAAMAATVASAQAPAPAPAAPAAKVDAAPKSQTGQWRASKLVGLDIYNEQNEKLGDINEVILDPSGKVTGYVIGVGGFLGAGEHDILVEPTKVKFVNEPARSATAPSTPSGTTGSTAPAPTNTRDVSNTTGSTRATTTRWYPDHGVLSATKDQLKAMPQFKYN
jgi:sporulation protein YlmC with PRC-barrel domain